MSVTMSTPFVFSIASKSLEVNLSAPPMPKPMPLPGVTINLFAPIISNVSVKYPCKP